MTLQKIIKPWSDYFSRNPINFWDFNLSEFCPTSQSRIEMAFKVHIASSRVFFCLRFNLLHTSLYVCDGALKWLAVSDLGLRSWVQFLFHPNFFSIEPTIANAPPGKTKEAKNVIKLSYASWLNSINIALGQKVFLASRLRKWSCLGLRFW